jgi:quercetin dioxygenase-like cupin family protein
MHEAGSRETAVVTQGTITLKIAGHEYRLQDGDSVTFDADLPHHFENPESEDEARFMSVVSAGLRRS